MSQTLERTGAVETPARSSGGEPVAAGRLRSGVLALGALGVVGTAIELATIEHWGSLEQLIPWIVLGVMAAVIAALALAPSWAVVRGAQLLGVATLGSAALGVFEHVQENLTAGPLDQTLGPRWDSMSTLGQWWAAASGQIGPAPLLAPGILAEIGLCVLLACWAHPALRADAVA